MLESNGYIFDQKLVRSGALLHDIARLQRLEATLDEAAIVFLADKLIQETQRVTIEKRFADSMSKCKSPEARKAHEQQLEQARKLQDMIQSLCHITL